MAGLNAGPVRTATDSAVVRLAPTDGVLATLRPCLRAFDGSGVAYGSAEIRAQIRAVEDAGLFWNPESRYPEEAF